MVYFVVFCLIQEKNRENISFDHFLYIFMSVICGIFTIGDNVIAEDFSLPYIKYRYKSRSISSQ